MQRDVVEEDVVPRTQPELVGGIRLDHDVSVVRGPGARDEVDPPREVADAHGGDRAFLGGPVAAGTRQVDLAGDGAIHRPGRRQLRQRPGQRRSYLRVLALGILGQVERDPQRQVHAGVLRRHRPRPVVHGRVDQAHDGDADPAQQHGRAEHAGQQW